MACDPVNLSQFVVYLRSRHLSYWDQFTAPNPRVSNSRQSNVLTEAFCPPCNPCTGGKKKPQLSHRDGTGSIMSYNHQGGCAGTRTIQYGATHAWHSRLA
eukprot:1162083-Pelagomonas_calceolata.AAC.15